ncbi:MAG: DUF4293 domain-containing protein [Bacteroidales bacterium]|nr:DUF4293 domain-containing protein [Bacteroidales bacterium]
MIQRKQTIFLILAILSFALLFRFPFASFELGTVGTCYIGILGLTNLDGFTGYNYMFIIMQILTTLFMSLTGVAIFMYKNRQLQIRLCALSLLINALLIGTMFFTASMVTKAISLEVAPAISYLWMTYIPMVTLLSVRFAIRAIRKDEAMVKSLNRLR